MIRSILFLFVALFINEVNLYSQSTVFALTSYNDIIRINPSNCTYDTVRVGNTLNEPFFTDIAYEFGELYLINSDYLYKVDLVNHDIYRIDLGHPLDPSANGLTSDHNGNLYVSGLNLKKFNIFNGILQDLGTLNFSTQGDLDFYNDRIYIAAQDSLGEGQLLEVELNPLTISVVSPIPTGVFGMTQYDSLNENEVLISKGTQLSVLNVSTGTISPLCPDIFNNFGIYGMASGTGYLTTPTVQKVEPVNIFEHDQNVNIQLESDIVGQTHYYLYNALGQLVLSSLITNDLTVIDLNEFSSGILFLTVVIPNGSSYQRKIVSY